MKILVMKNIYANPTIIRVLISLSFLYGCATGPIVNDPYYVVHKRQNKNIFHSPAAKNIPMLKEKNQFMLGGFYCNTPKLKGTEIHGGFMVSDHIGFIGSYRYMDYKEKEDEFDYGYMDNDYGNLNGFELGAGYVKRLSSIMHLESYAGYSNSRIKNLHHTGVSTIDQHNFFIQPAIGFNTKDNFLQVAIITRISRSNFKIDVETFNKDREQIVAKNLEPIRIDPTQYFIEPGIAIRLGSEYFHGQLSYSVMRNLSEGLKKYDGHIFSLGFVVQSPLGNRNRKFQLR